MNDEVTIDSDEALLRWVESGRILARDCLAAEKFPVDLITHLESPSVYWPHPHAGETIAWGDGEGRRNYVLTERTAAAIQMLKQVEWLEENLAAESVERYRLVTVGVYLVDCRARILVEQWKSQDLRDRQKALAEKAAAARRAIGDVARQKVAEGTNPQKSARHIRRLKAAPKKK